MKVIFLDIDGVLNFNGCRDKIGGIYFVNDNKIKLLKEIIDKTGAKIVLSSTWRFGWFERDYRGNEIKQWLDKWNGEVVEKFIIIDDDTDMKPYMNRLIQTSFKHGLMQKNVERAIKMLNE